MSLGSRVRRGWRTLALLVGDGDVGNGGDVAISAGTTWSIGNEGGIVAVYGGEGDSGGI